MKTENSFIVSVLITALMVSSFFGISLAGRTDLIPDPRLAEAISDELGVPAEEITPYHLLDLTELEAGGVKNLAGLLHAENIEKLTLKSLDHFARLEIVFELEELETLSVSDSRLRGVDIEEVSQLEELEELRLEGNKINQLPSFVGLGELEFLSLRNNEIVAIDELKVLRSIKVLDLSNNHIKDLSPLVELTRLHKLDLSGNRITELSPLLQNKGLGKGDVLYLQNNFLDFSPDSQDHENVKKLKAREIEITYLPQRTQKRRANFGRESN